MTDIKNEKKIWTRRDVLKTGGGVAAAAATPMFFMKDAWAEEAIGNYPVKGPTVKFGFNVPQTGAYADEGSDQLRGFKLAVEHLNNGGGMLETLKPSSLKGNGVLGKKVEYVTGDTQTNPDAARTSARRMIDRDGVIMWSGGSSSATAIAQQYLAQEKGVIYMDALTHSNDTTGKDKRRYGFRYFFNAHMTGKALAPVISKAYGKDRRAFHLTADYTWGHTQFNSMRDFTEAEGWTTVQNIMTPLKSTDFSAFLTAVLNSDADVLVLNHYGKNMVNSLTQAVQFGMRELQKNGKTMEIVVPLYSRLMAQGAGIDNVEGVYGTTSWSWKQQDAGSQAFTKAFEAANGFPPSQAAHVGYCQALLYANACEMAGTFYPPAVIKALEDFKFSGTGTGDSFYRGEDHQAMRDILVVQGNSKAKSTGKYDLLNIHQTVKAADVTYPVNTFKGELGPYKPA